MEPPRGTDGVWVESQTVAPSLVGQDERSEGASLPLAPGLSISNEIGAVLIDGIISQVHADVILGRERERERERERDMQLCGVSHFLSLPSRGP